MSTSALRYIGLDPHVLASGRTVTYGTRLTVPDDLDRHQAKRLVDHKLAIRTPPDSKPKRPRRRTTTDTED